MHVPSMPGIAAPTAASPPAPVSPIGAGDFDRHLAHALEGRGEAGAPPGRSPSGVGPPSAAIPPSGTGSPSRVGPLAAAGEARPGATPAGVTTAPAPRAEPVEGPGAGEALQRFVDEVTSSRRALDGAIRQAAEGRTFSPQELLALQARTYHYVQSVELAGKVVEQASAAVKGALGTQL